MTLLSRQGDDPPVVLHIPREGNATRWTMGAPNPPAQLRSPPDTTPGDAHRESASEAGGHPTNKEGR